MPNNHVFIFHATGYDGFVRHLRRQLEDHGIPVWVDSRNLPGCHMPPSEFARFHHGTPLEADKPPLK